MHTIAIIPARGGSKGVPGKNIKTILGKPLILYTIETALQSNLLSEIWISSDDEKILQIAGSGERVRLHHRNAVLAQDHSPITDTVLAIIGHYKATNRPDAIMLLQPTSPIREAMHIDDAIRALQERPAMKSLISVCPMDDVHPARMYWKKDEELEPILVNYEQYRRQDIPTAYYRNGSIYLVRTKDFLASHSLMVKPTFAFEMPEATLLNIDTPRDLLIAEPLIKAWKNGTLK